MSGISDQVAHFGATKLHATGPEHGKVKHGMELQVRKYNFKHVNIEKTQSVFILSENWSKLKYNSSRHVYELDALTTVQVMARQAYTHQEGTKFKLYMARTIA